MKYILIAVCIAICFAFVSCGTPKGGFVYIEIDGDKEALVQIGSQEPIKANNLSNPYDLEPMFQTIKVVWSGINKEETQIVDVHYGQTHHANFIAPKKIELDLMTQIPAKVKMGETVVGTSENSKITYYEGKFDFDVELENFDYKFKQSIQIKNNQQVNIVPGANEQKGSLYIFSSSKESIFTFSCSEKPILSEGCVFLPMITPGVVQVREKSCPDTVFYANIFPGNMTKLTFDNQQQDIGIKHNISPSLPNAQISLLVDWNGRGASVSNLGLGDLTLNDSDIERTVPLKPFEEVLENGAKYLKAVSNEKSGFVFVPRKFDENIKINMNLLDSSQMKKMPELLSNKLNSTSMPDGSVFYDPQQDAIASENEKWAIGLSSFVPCDWDNVNRTTLCYYRAEDTAEISFKTISWNTKQSIEYSKHSIANFKSDKPAFSRTGGFFWKQNKILGVIGTDKFTYLFESTTNGSKKLYNYDRPCSMVTLWGDDLLACEQGLEKTSTFFVVDLKNGKIYCDIAYPNITKDGQIVTSFNNIGVTAGALYKFGDGKLTPLWAGLLEH